MQTLPFVWALLIRFQYKSKYATTFSPANSFFFLPLSSVRYLNTWISRRFFCAVCRLPNHLLRFAWFVSQPSAVCSLAAAPHTHMSWHQSPRESTAIRRGRPIPAHGLASSEPLNPPTVIYVFESCVPKIIVDPPSPEAMLSHLEKWCQRHYLYHHASYTWWSLYNAFQVWNRIFAPNHKNICSQLDQKLRFWCIFFQVHPGEMKNWKLPPKVLCMCLTTRFGESQTCQGKGTVPRNMSHLIPHSPTYAENAFQCGLRQFHMISYSRYFCIIPHILRICFKPPPNIKPPNI